MFIGQPEKVSGFMGNVGDEGCANDACPNTWVFFNQGICDNLAGFLFGVLFHFKAGLNNIGDFLFEFELHVGLFDEEVVKFIEIFFVLVHITNLIRYSVI